MTSSEKQSLFEDDGSLCLDRLSDDAREVLEGCLEMLQTLGRKMFLPLDLMIILIHRGNRELAHVIAEGADGMVPVMELPIQALLPLPMI